MNIHSIINLIKKPEFLKFITVGMLTGMLLLSLTAFFTDFLHIFYFYSALIAYEISLICGFFMHDKWTFTEIQKTSKIHVRFIKFHMFVLISLGINMSVLVFLTTFLNAHYLISEGFAILIAFGFNYVMNKKITFRN